MVFDHLPWFTLTSTRVLVVQQDVIMIVLELATGGELFDFMMYTGSFPESTCGVGAWHDLHTPSSPSDLPPQQSAARTSSN